MLRRSRRPDIERMVILEYELKKCTKCGEEKPATSEFWNKHKETKDGFYPSCKSCHSELTKKYYESNRKKMLDYHKAYQNTNREKILEYRRKWSKDKGKNYSEWLKQGDVTKDQLKEIYRLSNGNCNYCGTEVSNPKFYPYCPNGFDHVIPRVKGGKHTASNIVVCCPKCNEKKRDKDVSEFVGGNTDVG
jgi:5-methylcytosine-specific restriction endonuclease McrA